ncbi:MAG: pro-sigmaK processing inhibitor BofA family protein [Bacillota bacterium]|jgi:inhibitor of the pro-sigma K processing machinery|nr:pro-sigmaK processing inhibitor BofA family protein [Bacillota bacterium]MDI9415954.1 pro-sigmaK processing inhibitor BofA family protein [Bacillota bacterium]NLD12954.1 pro-sigmaK processing inhibitor BofA [Bacillota bacterium]HAV20413.1 SigmaK-factor processing regulatory BofA [Bacillota bacterium]HOB89409.1 pro-sigmaK processing inhibitor BofA family protein [Bacillota bacterium]
MDVPLIMVYAFSAFIIYVLAYILYVPLKYAMRLLTSILVGGALLWITNLLGSRLGFAVAINPITALVSGTLGLPGVVLLVVLKDFIIKHM